MKPLLPSFSSSSSSSSSYDYNSYGSKNSAAAAEADASIKRARSCFVRDNQSETMFPRGISTNERWLGLFSRLGQKRRKSTT
jgi:hypothetical protein